MDDDDTDEDNSAAIQLGWKLVSGLAGLVAAMATRRAIGALRGSKEGSPPLNPADRRVGWGEAVVWTLALGVGGAVARLVAGRLAAAGWEAASGSPPPGVRPTQT